MDSGRNAIMEIGIRPRINKKKKSLHFFKRFAIIVLVPQMISEPKYICRCDGIGRRSGLKIHRWRHRAGSSPATGTSGKLPLPSRAPHVVGCVFFFAALVAGSYFVISARSAPRASRELHLCGVRSFFARVSHWRLLCLLNPG